MKYLLRQRKLLGDPDRAREQSTEILDVHFDDLKVLSSRNLDRDFVVDGITRDNLTFLAVIRPQRSWHAATRSDWLKLYVHVYDEQAIFHSK
jgi:hypothetical protein